MPSFLHGTLYSIFAYMHLETFTQKGSGIFDIY